ncbi:hypothetical protein LBMAG20_14200 [Methylocystaceae bacterium]|jgi:hypothetical protein|nr:hypothetical protein LBMAG20_14200 [Methylocystaceae bacterium]
MSLSRIVISLIVIVISVRIATLEDMSLSAKILIDTAIISVFILYLLVQIGIQRKKNRAAP